jgi:hypothetical protein
VLAGGALGALVEWLLLTRIYAKDQVLQLLVTFALFMILEDVQKLIWGVQPIHHDTAMKLLGTIDIPFGADFIPFTNYQLFVLPGFALVTLVGLAWFLRRTLTGRVIVAVTTDREAATAQVAAAKARARGQDSPGEAARAVLMAADVPFAEGLRRERAVVSRLDASAIAATSALQPPIGCHTPYSYSMNGRIVNRLGHSNGLMPRYFDWKLIARRDSSLLKYRVRCVYTDSHGRRTGATFIVSRFIRSRRPRIGLRRLGSISASFLRLSAMKRRNAAPSPGCTRSSCAAIFARSPVVSICVGAVPRSFPMRSRYIGSSRLSSTKSETRMPTAEKISSSTYGIMKKVGPQSKR